MARLMTIKPRVAVMPGRGLATAQTPSEMRITGRRLQDRRLRLWARDPRCASCRKLTDFNAFHLDHVVALVNGGPDTDENCQVLCIECHKTKTSSDLSL